VEAKRSVSGRQACLSRPLQPSVCLPFSRPAERSQTRLVRGSRRR